MKAKSNKFEVFLGDADNGSQRTDFCSSVIIKTECLNKTFDAIRFSKCQVIPPKFF